MRSASPSAGRAFALLAALMSVSIVVGLLLAGLALPAAWATGSATTGGVAFFNSLPDQQKVEPLSEQSTVMDASGRPIAHFYDERRIVVPITGIAKQMQQAIVAIEDSRFYQHGGVDLKGLLRAFVNNQVSDGSVQGASTLTQQYIKLTNLENAVASGDSAAQAAALSRTPARKLQEIRVAISLEKTMSKQEILTNYLNIANFGDGTYGIEAAAEYFFNGTSAAKLTLPQAALLAGLVQSPQRYSPFQHPRAALNRRKDVLTRMHELGDITDAEYAAALATPLGVKMNPPRSGCITSEYSYFCDYVRNLITKSSAFSALGQTEDERSTMLKRGGLTIRTTLTANIQDAAQAALDEHVPRTNPTQVGAAAVTVEPGTGKILAMAQDRTYDGTAKPGNTEINYNVDQDVGSGTGFQTGSTFKPFTLATWLAKGKGLYDVVDASGSSRPASDYQSCKGALGGPAVAVHNSEGHESGQMTVLDATANSVNVAYMDMATKLSLCDIAATATKLGVHKALAYDAGECQGVTIKLPDCTPSMVLGALNIAPLTMAAAYAAFADEGNYCTPVAVTSITDRDGKPLKVPATQCNQALDSNVALGVTYALKQVLTRGTAAGMGIGRPAAGKTGTTNDSVDTWFVGYTPQRTTAVWVGDNPNPANGHQRSTISGRQIGPTSPQTIFGATIAAPIWRSIMKVASNGLPEKDWPDPTGKVMTGSSIPMPDVHGQPIAQAQAALQSQGFTVTIGAPVPSNLQPDTVESTTPAAGSRVAPNSTVVIHPGDGQGAPGQGGQGQGGQGGGPNPGGGQGNGNNPPAATPSKGPGG
jgi:membrane peptidoglycan carboxypeptidase